MSSLLGPGDADVGQPTLLFHLERLTEGAHVGEDPLLHPDDEHDRELEALGRVQRHQDDGALVLVVERVGVGHQADPLQEVFDRLELAAPGDQLGQVLETALGLDAGAGAHLGVDLQLARSPTPQDRSSNGAGPLGTIGWRLDHDRGTKRCPERLVRSPRRRG